MRLSWLLPKNGSVDAYPDSLGMTDWVDDRWTGVARLDASGGSHSRGSKVLKSNGHSSDERRVIAMLDSPQRVVMCVEPEKFITFDSGKMRDYWRGGAEPGE